MLGKRTGCSEMTGWEEGERRWASMGFSGWGWREMGWAVWDIVDGWFGEVVRGL